jgi:hypothetical protein
MAVYLMRVLVKYEMLALSTDEETEGTVLLITLIIHPTGCRKQT